MYSQWFSSLFGKCMLEGLQVILVKIKPLSWFMTGYPILASREMWLTSFLSVVLANRLKEEDIT